MHPHEQTALQDHAQDSHDETLHRLTRRLLTAIAGENPTLQQCLSDWPTEGPSRQPPPASLPVLRHLGTCVLDAPPFSRDLVVLLERQAPTLAWHQTYSASELDAHFRANYGWTEIIGPRGPIDSACIACGFLLLGPGTLYPHHRHEAEELYVPLVGTTAWQQGDRIWRHHPPGTLIHHPSEEPHAMRTDDAPLLALYLWRSTQLLQSITDG
jgi:Dimethlysulfonioproprionate lyase